MCLVFSGSFEFTLFCLFWTYINLVQPPQECHAFDLKLLLYFKYSNSQPQPSKDILSSEPISITPWTTMKIYELQVFPFHSQSGVHICAEKSQRLTGTDCACGRDAFIYYTQHEHLAARWTFRTNVNILHYYIYLLITL